MKYGKLLFVAALAGPLVNASPTKVFMQLDWIFNAQFAGLYQAIEQGYYADAGLEVELAEAQKSVGVVESVLAHDGIAFGSSESNVLLGKRAAGAPVVAVGTMFQDSPMGWMSLASQGISSPADFAGKRVGIHADGYKVLQVALAKAGLTLDDVNMVEVGYDPQILLDDEVDVMQCYYLDEFVSLQQLTDGGGSIVLAKNNGYVAYSQVIFTTESIAETHPEVVTAFLEATRAGWEYACDHPEDTVSLILEQYNPDLDRAYQVGSLAKITELVRPDGAPALSPMSVAHWERSHDLFLEYGFLGSPVDLENFLRLDFLAVAP